MGFRGILLLGLLLTGVGASMKGNKFVVGFIETYFSDWFPEIAFYFLSEKDATVYIKSDGFHISDQVSVNAFTQAKYSTNISNYYQADLEVTDMSFYIESTENITVICLNYIMPRGDGYMALPFSALGNRYLLVSYYVDEGDLNFGNALPYTNDLRSAFLVIATEDSTIVHITLRISGPMSSNGCHGGVFLNGDTQRFILNKYQIVGSYCEDDITGTLIVSDKPVAVIVGQNFGRMMADANRDHNEEMLLPVEHLGLNYILSVPPAPQQAEGAVYRVVGSQQGTHLRTSDGIFGTVGEGDAFDLEVNLYNGPCYLQADKPVAVVQFTKWTSSMALVPATSQFTSSYDVVRLVTTDVVSYDLAQYFLTIVIPTDEVIGLQPSSLVPQFEVINGTCFSTGYIDMPTTGEIQKLYHTGGVNFGLIINTYVSLAFGYYSFIGGLSLQGHAGKTECPQSLVCDDGMPFPCNCTDGFFSYSCNDTSSACSTDPCVFSTNCTELVTSYVCDCMDLAAGAHCEHDIFDHCIGNMCVHGTCVDMISSYICKCKPGYKGQMCETDIDECAATPCQNDGTCSQFIAYHTCSCPPGFSGLNCETDIDECESAPCLNDGTCSHYIAYYNCSCPPGFSGDQCEIDFDECESNPCVNGTCNDLANMFNCTCTPGYEGELCDAEIDECVSTPCQNNAECVDLLNAVSCTCPDGFSGSMCENDINECESGPCVNGDCSDGVNNYTCSCFPGYEGGDCQQDIDDCASSPCVNGTCNDLVNMFNCTCTPGYEGELCDADIDDCASGPCENGDCSDGLNTYMCTCSPGFKGTDCELEIDECASSPCLNNGNCTDIVNGYECVCPEGITGTICEIGGDPCAVNPCGNNGTCKSTESSFSCTCAAGFEGDRCDTDIDECASNPCQNDGTCKDGVNTFECLCRGNASGLLCELLLTCGCPCQQNMTDSELEAKLAWIRSVLLVDKGQLSASIRKKISVVDDRPASNSIGFSGLVCLIGAFGFFILMDGINVLRFFITKPTPTPPKVYALK